MSSNRNSSDDSSSGGKTIRQRLIEEAQLRCHEARSNVLQAKLLANKVPRESALRFQQTLVDYYAALRPLRDEEIVADWWDDVTLSEHWIKDVRVETEPVVTGDYLGTEQVSVQQQKERVVEHYEGLDTIEKLDSMTEEKTVSKKGMRGRRTETVSRLKVLDIEILKDISFTLDDAADKLGFGPEVESEMPRDETDLEDLKGSAPIATLPQGERPDLSEFNVDVGGD
jgi:hypothetical protein